MVSFVQICVSYITHQYKKNIFWFISCLNISSCVSFLLLSEGKNYKRKIPAIRSKEITYRVCKALKDCLISTPCLSCIELQGLPLRERDMAALAKVHVPQLPLI